jgi:hypothetical protein
VSGQDLKLRMERKLGDMNKCILSLGRLGRNAAETEYDYRVALAKEELRLKEAGASVTLIPDLARGTVEVAKLKMLRDIAESLQKANIECINALKVEIRIVEGWMEKEWGASE